MAETPTPPPIPAATLKPKRGHPMLEAFDELLGVHAQIVEKNADGEALTSDDKAHLKRYEEGLQKMLDIIAPAGMEVRTKELIINDQVARTLYAYNWPL
jgi:hypothetical protein